MRENDKFDLVLVTAKAVYATFNDGWPRYVYQVRGTFEYRFVMEVGPVEQTLLEFFGHKVIARIRPKYNYEGFLRYDKTKYLEPFYWGA